MTRTRLLALVLILASSAGSRAADDEQPGDQTLGLKPPEGAVVLFDGKALDAWTKARDATTPADWPVFDGLFQVGRGDIRTKATFGDCRLHLEFNIPYMPEAKGQARGNSGVYLAGRHELQVLDSYGLEPQDNDCGAIYKQVVPRVNACKPPLRWQAYDVTFRKARVEGGKVVKRARITVVQNGLTIIDDREIDPTPGGLTGPGPDPIKMGAGEDGPLLLQDHGNPVQYRNIWLVPLKD